MTEHTETFHVVSHGAAPAVAAANEPTQGAPALGSERDPFSRGLRVIGALLLAASASNFMFQHWSQHSDVARYWMLLGHTLTVTLAAVLCSTGLRAARSARTLFGMVLASTPVHFTVLGALLYSRIGAASSDLPSSAVWAAPTLGAAALTAAGAAALLVPASLLALSVLTRSHARVLGAVLAFSNATLLIPVREPTLIGGLIAGLTLGLLVIDRHLELAHELRTFEGRAVRLLCFAPLCVMAGRAVLYYNPTVAFASCVLAALGWTWFSLWGHGGFTQRAVQAQRYAIAPIALAAYLLVSQLIVESVAPLCFCALITALVIPMGQRALGGFSFYGAAAGLISCISAAFDMLEHQTALAALVAIIVGACAMVGAALIQRFGLLLAAAVTTATAVCFELWLIVDVGAVKHWGTLAAAGVVLILGAAVLEKHGRSLGMRALAMREQIVDWDW